MANHKQTKKRSRQIVTRTVRNRHIRSTMRTNIKRLGEIITKGDLEASKGALQASVKLLDKAVTQGILHRKTASRTISRLTIAVNKIA